MMKSFLYLSAAVAALTAACPARAADKPDFAPPPAWVKLQSLPDIKTNSDMAQIVMMDRQVRFGDDEDAYYSEIALRIQTPQGLMIGRPSIYWNPDTDRIVVHKVHILRDGKVIDVLAAGQTFTLLRREANLDSSVLDGMLTGVLQPEGLQVNDVIDYAFTVYRTLPVLHGHSEFQLTVQPSFTIGRISLRAVWDAAKPMRWQVSDDIKDAKLTRTAQGSEWTLALSEYTTPVTPARAPDRYARTGLMTFTQFASWRDLSALMGPLYDKASTLAPDSPLHAEVETIRQLTPDPKARAAAALRLVEDKVRYVFVAADQAALIPADADVTWTRRFGDCKGKSALLLALLRQLGIEADAVSVSTKNGDGLDQSLPVVEAFDHVIVRAVIDGHTYWLDGTRQGDGGLDALPVPDYHWALPMRTQGADLVPMVIPTPEKPTGETLIRLDASAGLDAPASAHMEFVMRGEAARQVHKAFAAQAPKDLEASLKDYASEDYDWESVDTATQTFDETTGEQRVVLDGKLNLSWESPGAGQPRGYTADGVYIGGAWDPDRKDAIRADAPVTIYHPTFATTTETIILPKGGKGFSVSGEPVDKTLGGYAMKRSFSLKDGVFTMVTSERTLQSELPLAEFKASKDELQHIGQGTVVVRAPFDYAATDGDLKAIHAEQPETAADYMVRGKDRADAGQYEAAIADYDAAMKLDPRSARAIALRGDARAASGSRDAALADYDAAVRLDHRDLTAWYGRIALYQKARDLPHAMEAATRALDINPADTNVRMERARMFLETGDRERALDDGLAARMMAPDSFLVANFLAGMYFANYQRDQAIELIRGEVRKAPDDAAPHALLAELLADCEQVSDAVCTTSRAEAVAEYDKAIAIEPRPDLYIARAVVRPDTDHAPALADLDQALSLEPDSIRALLARAHIRTAMVDYTGARADLDAVLAQDPDNIAQISVRADLLEAQGDIDGYIAQLDALVARQPDTAVALNNACWGRVKHGRDLARARELCDLALTRDAHDVAALDSRGLVNLQTGMWAQAEQDYTAAMDIVGDAASALYGRGIARLRLGRKSEGKADLAAAKKLSAGIADAYAGYGVKP